MGSRTRKASWFVSGLLLAAAVSAGLEVVAARPGGEDSRPAPDAGGATFEWLGEQNLVNINNVTYACEVGNMFDVYFACSSARGTDPLRLIDANDVKRAKSYFNDERRYGGHFVKINKYCINMRNIAYIEFKDDSAIVNFNSRLTDAFIQLTLFGADAEAFRKMRRESEAVAK